MIELDEKVAKDGCENYHELFIPFTDVYELGGPTVFKGLERKVRDGKTDLIVIPSQFIDDLDKIKKTSEGADKVLEELRVNVCRRINKYDYNFLLKNKIIVYSSLEGLDVAVADLPFDSSANIAKSSKKIENLLGKEPKFITNDSRLSIMLTGIDACVEPPKFLMVNADIVNEGIITGSTDLETELYQNRGKLSLEDASVIMDRDLFLNQFIRFVGKEEGKEVYARVTGELAHNKSGSRIIDVKDPRVILLDTSEYGKKMRIGEHFMDDVLGVYPKDMEQYLAFQYGLLNQDVSVFFLCGGQGSGKTLLSYAAAVDQVLWYDSNVRSKRRMSGGKGGFFKQIVLFKPIEIVGGERRNVGYLKGSLLQKLAPHLESFEDSHNETALRNFMPFSDMFRHPKFELEQVGEIRVTPSEAKLNITGSPHLTPSHEMIKLRHSGFSRGISLTDNLVIIDEAQNFTPYEMKTLMQRMGMGSKYIITGDPRQVDNPRCSREINGLTHAIKHFLPQPYTALVSLVRNYRHQASRHSDSWEVPRS